MDSPAPEARTPWFAMPADEVVAQLSSDCNDGLSVEDAASRLQQHGPNSLPEEQKPSRLRRFLAQFNNVLIYILLASAVLTLVLRHYPDTAVILLVVIVNACIGYIQESRAEKAMDAVRNILAVNAHVIRDGRRVEVPAEEVTVGDIVRLSPGDKVPADLRLIESNNLRIEESALTGEAEPATKSVDPVQPDTGVGDRTNMAFSSTTVSAGTGLGIVVAIGRDTQIGGINQMLTKVESIKTPLLRQMDALSTKISIVVIVLAAAVYGFGYFFRDYERGELALSVIGLAIGAIPEGLPAIMSIILALGVQSMAKRHAIVRNLPSVETLGAVSVICSDKTGTLTKNEMTVTDLTTRAGEYEVTGRGYAPDGEVEQDGKPVDMEEAALLRSLLTCFAVCNESELAEVDGHWTVRGEPTEGALLTAASKAGIDPTTTTRTSVLPFDSQYKYMAVLTNIDGEDIICIKGAPDKILAMAGEEETSTGRQPLDENFWGDEIIRLAGQGKRTIAAAYKKAPSGMGEVKHEDLSDGIVFLGLAGIIDPPRDEAIMAVEECAQAGITVKMITGDHAQTALAIGCQMGIGDGEHALTGADLDGMDDEQLREAAATLSHICPHLAEKQTATRQSPPGQPRRCRYDRRRRQRCARIEYGGCRHCHGHQGD